MVSYSLTQIIIKTTTEFAICLPHTFQFLSDLEIEQTKRIAHAFTDEPFLIHFKASLMYPIYFLY